MKLLIKTLEQQLCTNETETTWGLRQFIGGHRFPDKVFFKKEVFLKTNNVICSGQASLLTSKNKRKKGRGIKKAISSVL